jgi:hypothetical protein
VNYRCLGSQQQIGPATINADDDHMIDRLHRPGGLSVRHDGCKKAAEYKYPSRFKIRHMTAFLAVCASVGNQSIHDFDSLKQQQTKCLQGLNANLKFTQKPATVYRSALQRQNEKTGVE